VTKDEALHLALEELENCADLLKVFEAPIDSCVGATMLQAEATITAIKQALAAPVQEHEPAVPDALTSADIQEHIEYVAGWNDCRAEMLKGMK
jgi:hypothetical protein